VSFAAEGHPQNLVYNIPLGLLDVIVFASIVYWVVGLYGNAWRFLYFVLVLFLVNQTLYGTHAHF
jgi:uncharacterized phage infection (PIP) family protein YhgE